MNKKILQILIIIIFSVGNFTLLLSQNSGIGINPTGNNPDPSAALDVDFNNKGLLIPRLTTVQRDAIQNPAVSLQIYNTSTNCLQIYMPTTGWRDIACDCSASPSSAFTFPNNSSANTNIAFQATTPGANYSWTFDQGAPATSNQQSPTVVWSTAGTYTVTLTVTDNLGCSSTTTQSITIINCISGSGSTTFSYTGVPQQWTVPNLCNNTITIEIWGADGGSATSSSVTMPGGKGGFASGDYTYTPGETLDIYVGGHGGNASGSNVGGGGGGMSDVINMSNTVVIVGGGGGGGACGSTASERSTGGAGGGLTGGTAIDGSGVSTGTAATGGTQSAGGSATAGSYGVGTPGGFGYGGGSANGGIAGVRHGAGGNGGHGGIGGWNGGGGGCTSTGGNDHSAGGGAGYYGGGGGRGDGGAGGGGSSYIGGVANGVTIMDGQPNFVPNPDVSGDGFVRITW